MTTSGGASARFDDHHGYGHDDHHDDHHDDGKDEDDDDDVLQVCLIGKGELVDSSSEATGLKVAWARLVNCPTR